MTTSATGQLCPLQPGSDRRVIRSGEESTPAVEFVDGVWHIRSYDLAKEVLRERDDMHQSGFNAEFLSMKLKGMRMPILYGHGAEHRKQRTAVARFFTPKAVQERYHDLMESSADTLIAKMTGEPSSNFSDVAYLYSVEIASRVLGLDTLDLAGVAKRLYRMFHIDLLEPGKRVPLRAQWRMLVFGNINMLRFWFRDVRPSVAARRAQRQDDVISYLLDAGFTEAEILTEAVTYGAAGMITTREFLQVALWHLLDDEALRTRYLEAEFAERQAILLEILRLEPVVGHLYRRAKRDFTLTAAGQTFEISEGDRLDLYIRATNTDPTHFDPEPERLCPGRELGPGVRPEAMSFGDGVHRCPGNSLAMLESDVLLSKLLRHDVRLVAAPSVGWEDIVAGYELQNFRVKVRPLS